MPKMGITGLWMGVSLYLKKKSGNFNFFPIYGTLKKNLVNFDHFLGFLKKSKNSNFKPSKALEGPKMGITSL
jgi:hypothetical protein